MPKVDLGFFPVFKFVTMGKIKNRPDGLPKKLGDLKDRASEGDVAAMAALDARLDHFTVTVTEVDNKIAQLRGVITDVLLARVARNDSEALTRLRAQRAELERSGRWDAERALKRAIRDARDSVTTASRFDLVADKPAGNSESSKAPVEGKPVSDGFVVNDQGGGLYYFRGIAIASITRVRVPPKRSWGTPHSLYCVKVLVPSMFKDPTDMDDLVDPDCRRATYFIAEGILKDEFVENDEFCEADAREPGTLAGKYYDLDGKVSHSVFVHHTARPGMPNQTVFYTVVDGNHDTCPAGDHTSARGPLRNVIFALKSRGKI